MANITQDMGVVTAYGAAVEGGYTGTYAEFCEQQASYAQSAAAVEQAKEDAEQAASDAATSEQNASDYADNASNYATNASGFADDASGYASQAQGYSSDASGYASQASDYATNASNYATNASNAQTAAETAQGLAEDAQEAAESARDAVAASAAQIETNRTAIGTLSNLTTDEKSNLVGAVNEVDAEISTVKEDLSELTTRVDDIEEAEGLHRYGVSGIGQAASALTRIWDSVGMTARVGTDGDNSGVINNFDDVTPFNRRKCVGKWHLENGRSVFRVRAYLGDENYTEDGSMGDYVAVECPRAYYYLKDGVLGVSAHHYPGWRPFDIFCRNHDPEDTFEYYYMPAYALAIKDGHAVSLPGLSNAQGDYASLMAAARTYDGDVSVNAVTQPMAVNFYEWALFTVEFATQNCQSIMQGCCGLRHSNDDRATLREDGKWLLSNYYASRVVGEAVSIQPTNIDINHYTYLPSHTIASIVRCDADGNPDPSGTHQLVETNDLGLAREYVVGESYRFAARPWLTGSCNGVSTPSGSPACNSNSYYPCKYRWHENPYSNQYKTVCDLFNMRVGTDDSDYSLEWYFAPDPTAISGNPTASSLATDAFSLLDAGTDHEHYVSGYIKSKLYSAEIPDIWIPHGTTGASTSTYFCDYASLVFSYVVRSVRLGGSWYYGANDGFSFCHAYSAPGSSHANSGADLFISKQG